MYMYNVYVHVHTCVYMHQETAIHAHATHIVAQFLTQLILTEWVCYTAGKKYKICSFIKSKLWWF